MAFERLYITSKFEVHLNGAYCTLHTPQYPFQLLLCLYSYVWILLDLGSSYPFHFRSLFDTGIGITNR